MLVPRPPRPLEPWSAAGRGPSMGSAMIASTMNKVVPDAASAVRDIPDGASIMISGFGLCGIPENLIGALRDKGPRDLTCISNNAGTTEYGMSVLLRNGQVRRMISTYVGENK